MHSKNQGNQYYTIAQSTLNRFGDGLLHKAKLSAVG
jgi:hypothetical protein